MGGATIEVGMRVRLAVSSAILVAAFAGTASGVDLFPVTNGTTWQMGSTAIATKMTVAVQDATTVQGVKRATLQIASPWVGYGFLVRSTDAGMMLEGINFGSGVTKFPEPDPLFPTGTAGQVFQGYITRVTILSAGVTVSTPWGPVSGATAYSVQFNGGDPMVWYVKPGQGIVQFGEGVYAFKLESQTIVPETVVPPPPPPVMRACPLIGIEPNPLAYSDFSYSAREAAMQTAVQRGKNFTVVSASWATLEPMAGNYDFTLLRETLDRAARYNLPVALTLKTIDTSVLSIPSDLKGLAWTSSTLQSRFNSLLQALVPILGSSVKWLHIGNEVDVYLTQHPAEVAGYLSFFNTGAAQAKSLRPDLAVGIVFAYDTYRQTNSVFRDLEGGLTHIGFTYYAVKTPTAASPGMQRDPSNAAADLADMMNAARGRSLILTEAGYSSSTAAGSSLQLQSDFYAAVFASLKTSGGKVQAVNFSFLNDIPRAVAEQLMSYVSSSDRTFVDWLAALGTIDGQGTDKPAAIKFEENATLFKSGPVCQ